MKGKVVITGGAGFIGSNLAEALLTDGYEVVIVDNLSEGKRENIPSGAVLHIEDILNTEALKHIFKGATFVFHCAALPRVQFSIEHPQTSNTVNVDGTLSVLLAARDAGVKRVIYSASSSAYGDQETMPLSEDMRPAPVHPYGLQKLVGEQYAKLFTDLYGLETVSLRYFNVYGPKLNPDGAYALVIGVFLKQKQQGQVLTICGDGEQTRDFTHVRDVVRANMFAATKAPGKGEVINIGAGRSVSVKYLASLFGGDIQHVPPRIEPKHSLASNNLAKTLLEWEPQVQLEEGVEELKRLFNIA